MSESPLGDASHRTTLPEGSHEHPPVSAHGTRKRRGSSVSHVSHVDIEFFDPKGVQDLRRTLSRQQSEHRVAIAKGSARKSDTSDHTVNCDEGTFNFEKTLRDGLQMREDAGIEHRTLGVAFKDLRVVGIAASDSYMPTVGSVFNPASALEKLKMSRHPTLKTILSGFEGVVQPGEMLLVLGSPGSGCTTLLKTLANHRQGYHSITGDVHYDALTPEQLYKQFRGDVQYCPEDDIHFPMLTVDQTIHFASTIRTPRQRVGTSRKDFAVQETTILETLFGLRHAQSTPVGDAARRGVSGGEKKRVSLAEALASRACIGAWDNSTRGLDASTALEFVRALRIATDTFKTTTIVSLYQAGEQLYQHFDKVCLIYEGRMAYFGPADEARQYFLDMGYEPANRQTTADFLVAVSDPNARIPRAGFSNQPRTADEFAQYFIQSQLGKQNRSEVEDYLAEKLGNEEKKAAYMRSAHAEFAKRSAKSGPYLLTIPQQITAVMRRRAQVIRGDTLATGINIFSFIFQGLIMGSVFFKSSEDTGAFFSRAGVMFFAILFSALSAMAEIPALYAQRPIVLRHEKAAFYHPWVEAMALTLVDIPITFGTIVIFAIILYFMVGLQKTADQFLIFFLFIFSISVSMKGWFRSIAATFTSQATAQTFAGVSVLAMLIYTGFAIPKPSMIGALRWITYINPVKYGFEAVMTNEFRTLRGSCINMVPQGPGYENVTIANQVCATVGAEPGENFVDGNRFVELSYGFSWSNTWMNLGIIFGFGIGFVAALLVISEYRTSSVASSTSITLFKRPNKRNSKASSAIDEEKGGVSDPINEKDAPQSPRLDIEAPRMNDIFSWQHINYTVPISGKPDRKLLNDVCGYVAPGMITALMGESGAGKTTLLNVLAARTSVGVVTGDRMVNGQALPADFQSQTGYCQQQDTHVELSTVREALMFSAKLRQPPSVSIAEKEAYVEKCLEMCGLTAFAEASVGSLGVEHKKRTTIAVELAAKPKLLLFLDEPTSGLDSQSAWAIMTFLRDLAEKGQAILCTIHQPSAELFQIFDRLLLLKKGGETVYFGDLGDKATTLISYFEKNGARKCLSDENPAEYMLDVIGAGATASSEQDWFDIWSKSPEAQQAQVEIEKIHVEGRNRPAVEATIHSEFATPWTYQLKELIIRDHQTHWRDPTYIVAKLALNAIGGLFVGFTFFRSKNTQQGIQNKLFSIFMATVLAIPVSNQLQVPFLAMRGIYEIRERPSRMYSWTALITSQLIAELPWNILASIILFFCWYWPVGFDADRAGYTFLMVAIALPVYCSSFGQATAAMAPSPEIAAAFFNLFFSFVITFNGVMQPFRQLGWWQWMYRLSPFTYLIEGLLGQAIGRQEITCSAIELVTLNPPAGQTCGQYMANYISFAGGYVTDPSATSDCKFCSVKDVDQFLDLSFNIFYKNHWRDFGLMIAFSVFNVVLIYLFTYIFRIRRGIPFPRFSKKKN